MITELTIDQAKEQPANFMYIFASDEFLNAISPKYKNVIVGKAANQRKLLMLSAKKYLGDENLWVKYSDAIRQGFMNIYGITPAEALVDLALGKTVAGKNWKEGVFGVGALKITKFKGTDISVNKSNGYMVRDGKLLPVYDTVYNDSGAYQQFYYDEASGKTYMSQKIDGKWYAASYSDKDGQTFSASGIGLSSADQASIWEAVIMNIGKFLEWLISLFSGGKTEMINEENTLPNQKTDGFVYQSGLGEAGAVMLLLAAGGALMASGALGGKRKSK